MSAAATSTFKKRRRRKKTASLSALSSFTAANDDGEEESETFEVRKSKKSRRMQRRGGVAKVRGGAAAAPPRRRPTSTQLPSRGGYGADALRRLREQQRGADPLPPASASTSTATSTATTPRFPNADAVRSARLSREAARGRGGGGESEAAAAAGPDYIALDGSGATPGGPAPAASLTAAPVRRQGTNDDDVEAWESAQIRRAVRPALAPGTAARGGGAQRRRALPAERLGTFPLPLAQLCASFRAGIERAGDERARAARRAVALRAEVAALEEGELPAAESKLADAGREASFFAAEERFARNLVDVLRFKSPRLAALRAELLAFDADAAAAGPAAAVAEQREVARGAIVARLAGQLDDVTDQYRELDGVLARFERWRTSEHANFREAYERAYVALSLPTLVGLFVDLELATAWRPFGGGSPAPVEGGGGGAPHRALPRGCAAWRGQHPLAAAIVAERVVPFLAARIERVWDPSAQSDALARAMHEAAAAAAPQPLTAASLAALRGAVQRRCDRGKLSAEAFAALLRIVR